MKRIVTLILMVVATNIYADVIRLSKPVAENATSETFGTQFDSQSKALSLSEVMNATESYQAEPFLLQTEIAKVCQKKGCFFIARDAGHAVRVSFKDYGFFIPTDASGKTVLLQGELVAKNVTDKQAAHFNKDLGEGASLTKGPTFEIVASGITIPKS
jgi:hypothetical protein